MRCCGIFENFLCVKSNLTLCEMLVYFDALKDSFQWTSWYSNLERSNDIMANFSKKNLSWWGLRLTLVDHKSSRSSQVEKIGGAGCITCSLNDVAGRATVLPAPPVPAPMEIEYKLCPLTPTWQWVTWKSPAYLASLLTTTKSRGSMSRSADRGDVFIPRTRLRQGERAFSVAAPRQWNRLPILRSAVFRIFVPHQSAVPRIAGSAGSVVTPLVQWLGALAVSQTALVLLCKG